MLDHVTVWLFKLNQITRQQLTTILARAQIDKKYPIKETFEILDDDGKFTREAKQFVIPMLSQASFIDRFTSEHLERFRLLMEALPKSEQIFYISKSDPRIISERRNQLGDALEGNSTWVTIEAATKRYDLHLSFGATEAQQIVLHGVNGAAANRAVLGKVSLDNVEEGVKYYYRPTAISINDSGIASLTKGIHEYAFSPMPAVTAHDVLHAKLHSTIPPEFNMMLNHMKDILAEQTGFKWSTMMWELIDREMHAFQHSNIVLDRSGKNGVYFNQMFTNVSVFCGFIRHEQLTNEGIILLLHMVKNPDIWKKLYKIDIDCILEPLASHIRKMKDFKSYISENDSQKMIHFKYRLFCALPNKNDFLIAENIMKDHEDLENDLFFTKVRINHNIKNAIELSLKSDEDQRYVHRRNVENIVSDIFFKNKIDSMNHVDELLEVFSKEFKSVSKDSHFATIFTDNDKYQQLSSFEKIILLEKSCDAIMRSKQYGNSWITSIFSFIKNPLTNSQRSHMKLIKDSFRDVLKDYMNDKDVTPEEKEKFIFAMKNRSSKLMDINLEKFNFGKDDKTVRRDLSQTIKIL